jgi:hypothetical protein
MSRLTSIFRRRGDETGPGQETESQPAAASGAPTAPETPSFHHRGRLRRRLRYLRRVRELQLRDLGGLVYETYRMSRPRQDLVERKVSVLAATDAELTGLEHALDDVRPMLEMREPGIGGQCPRCGEIFGSDARFCSHCGAGLAGAPAATLGQVGAAAASGAAAAPAPGAAPAGSSVLSHWTAPATPGAPAGSPATPGAPAGSPATPSAAPSPSPAPSPTASGPTGPTPASAPAASQAASPPAAAAPQPQAPVRKAPPPSGSQGIASGDPLGQAAPAPPEEPTVALRSGDPLAAKSAATEPDAKPTEPEAVEPEATPTDPKAKPAEPDATSTRPEAKPTEPQAGNDETVVMPPTEQGGAGANGADESRPAKARAAGAQDEPE